MNKLLQLKHWQLFTLIFALPILAQIIMLAAILSHSVSTHLAFIFLPIVMLVFIGTLFCWLYALGTNLYKKLPATVHMNITKFKVLLFIPAIYILFILCFVFNLPTWGLTKTAVLIIIPIHLCSMFCIFYCIYFNAKALKAVELQRPVTANDYAGEFFLLMFFPIGVWLLQPRVNKLFGNATNDTLISTSL